MKKIIILSLLLSLLLPSCAKKEEVKTPHFFSEKDYDYVIFGHFPNSIKEKKVKITDETKTINGRICYKGSDGEYYLKQRANIKVTDVLKFSNGDEIESGKDYFFKIEGIKWKIVSEKEGLKLLVAENILSDFYFSKPNGRKRNNKNLYPNNYAYSEVRHFLNSLNGTLYNVGNYENKGFIDLAFSEDEKKLIKKVTLNNNDTRGNPYIPKDTEDKVFLLSLDEIKTLIPNKERNKSLTDFAKALGQTSSSYFLRTPDLYSSNSVEIVNKVGIIEQATALTNYWRGIVPALFLSDKELDPVLNSFNEDGKDYVYEEVKSDEQIETDGEYIDENTKEFSLHTQSSSFTLYHNIENVKDYDEKDYMITSKYKENEWCEKENEDLIVRWIRPKNIITYVSTTSGNFETLRGIKCGDSIEKIKKAYEKDFDLFINDEDIRVSSYNKKAEEEMVIKFTIEKDKVSKIEIATAV